jgi:hypothetical protein
VRRAILIRVGTGVGFLAISAYAFSRGTGFWNITYGVLGAVVGVGSLAVAAFLIIAKHKGIAPTD